MPPNIPTRRSARCWISARLPVILIGLALGGGGAAAGEMLVVSDIHFNPMAEPALTDALAAAPATEWAGILAPSTGGALAAYQTDTNWALLHSAIGGMRRAAPKPDLIVVPGDFLAHDFRALFNAAASDKSDGAYRQFVAKTITFVTAELQAGFPETRIFPTLGNNDEDCGDYASLPADPFLGDMSPVVRRLAHAEPRPFETSWSQYGGYMVPHPTVPGVRLIFLDSVFFSIHYHGGCGAKDADPGGAVLDWLSGLLEDAAQAHAKVWLVYHIPPGVDAFASKRAAAKADASCAASVKTMWQPRYLTAFTALMRKYADVIETTITGHTHMDEFRILGDAAGPVTSILGTPGLTPFFGQNPAFRKVSFNADGAIVDQAIYYLENLPTARGDTGNWRLEYDFRKSWNIGDLGMSSLIGLNQKLLQDHDAARRWQTLYSVSRRAAAEQARPSAEICAIGNSSPEAFSRCFCPPN